MQISNNYQIFPNKNYVNCSYKNSLKYQGQNIAFGQLSGQKTLTSLPKQFKTAVVEEYKTLNSLLCKYMPNFQTEEQYQTALKE